MPKRKKAFMIAGLMSATAFLMAHPASARFCGCHSSWGQWVCTPSVTYCANECRDTYKVYSDRASCFEGRPQSQKPARKKSQSKKKS
jgi:hypothetical protein